jgi:predicted transcriptional regulator
MLPEKMIAILRFVHGQEKSGKTPSHRDICAGLNVTRNTARKRIRYLAGRGFLVETKNGRKKLVELTQKGKELL